MPSHASDSSLSTNMHHSSIGSSMSSSEHLPSRMHDMGGYARRSMHGSMASHHEQGHMHQPAHPHMHHHNNFVDSMQQVRERGAQGAGGRGRSRAEQGRGVSLAARLPRLLSSLHAVLFPVAPALKPSSPFSTYPTPLALT